MYPLRDKLLVGRATQPLYRTWWINPWLVILFLIVPILFLAVIAPDILPKTSLYLRTRQFFNWTFFGLALAFFAVLAASAYWAGKPDPIRPAQAVKWQVAPFFLDVLAILSIGAYVLWFHRLFIDPTILINFLLAKGVGYGLSRQENAPIPGLTSMVQFGIAYVIFYLNQKWAGGGKGLGRRHDVYFWLLISLSLVRVFAWAERLALIEVMLPVVLLYARHRARLPRPVYDIIRIAGPYVGFGFLLVYFGGTEYFRSWIRHYQFYDTGFWDFAVGRLLSYYYTALNNGAGLLTIMDWPTWTFGGVFGWIYRFPILGRIIQLVIDVDLDQVDTFLVRYADLEFNNMSGVFAVIFQIGLVGGLVYATLWGATVGYFYRTYVDQNGAGAFFYPAIYISLLESIRFLYLGHSRAFPIFLALTVGYIFFTKRVTNGRRESTRLRTMRPALS